MSTRTWRLSTLLLGSGCCALIYQTAWIREFRLIFGASTAASAAVLAIFIGGLGLGGWLLGRRADAHARPILFYAQLETIVAISAALSPLLLLLVRELYVYLGGTPKLGLVVGTAGRLLLSGLVLAIPTVAMGGTLPAVARAATGGDDVRRRNVAALYALNTVGAVIGTLLSTFVLLEALGNRETLWLAAALNLLIAMVARQLDRVTTLPADLPAASEAVSPSEAQAPAGFALLASGVVGFAFFLMELVWYRMLGPLLGGTVFTFSLILAVALAGIGIGGLVYAVWGSERRPSLRGFAACSLLEALAMAIPYALGDRLAVLTVVLQPLGHAAFGAGVFGWSAIAAIVVLPASIVAGYQFPMLIALLGRGRLHVGRQIGLAYAANTIGAIVGSLAGGFGLLPWLSAPGAWRFVTISLIALSAAALALSDDRRSPRKLLPHAALMAATLLLLTALGPTAVWRHSGVGTGRAALRGIESANHLKAWANGVRRSVVWDGDGIESSVALVRDGSGYAFMVNGKADGSARYDSGTQVMVGLLGSILNPHARRAMVIGLGTGSTAGWLGAVPAIERVDVVELEPLILDVARACRDVNHNVLENPKVHITIGDAREALLTSRETYDVIASEPSNPFRAGIASLFTREYYRAVNDRLSPDGVFVQWVQAYEIDTTTMRTVFATMAASFPYVETWETRPNDFVLVGSKRPLQHRTSELAARIQEEPFRTALRNVWQAVDLTGVLAHFIAGDPVTRAIASAPGVDVNTDDRNVVEFGLARSVGLNTPTVIASVRQLAATLGANRPLLDNPGTVDWTAVDTAWIGFHVAEQDEATEVQFVHPTATEDARRQALVSYYLRSNAGTAREVLSAAGSPAPRDLNELSMVADIAARNGDERAAMPFIEQLRQFDGGEADTILAMLRVAQRRFDEAAPLLQQAFAQYRRSPWALTRYKDEALELARTVAESKPALAQSLYDALREPFSVSSLDERRLLTRLALARTVNFKGLCRDAITPLESPAVWTQDFLSARRDCYAATGDSRLAMATHDLVEYVTREPMPITAGVKQAAAPQLSFVP